MTEKCLDCGREHTDEDVERIAALVMATLSDLDRVEAATTLRHVIDRLRETL